MTRKAPFFSCWFVFCLLTGCGDSAAPTVSEDEPRHSIWPLPEIVGIDDAPGDNPWLTEFGAESSGSATTASPDGATKNPGGAAEGEASETAATQPDPPPRWAVFRAYVETTSSAKALVIDEPGGAALAGCQVVLFSNGGTERYRSFELTSATSRAVLCIGEPGIACDDWRTGNAFNGDDAVTLECDGAVRDVVGQVGIDPGDAWLGLGADGVPLSTKDQALWRCTHPTEQPGAFTWTEWMRWNPATEPLPDGPSCPTPPPNDGVAGSSGS